MIPPFKDLPIQPRLRVMLTTLTVAVITVVTIFSLIFFFQTIASTAIKTMEGFGNIVEVLLAERQKTVGQLASRLGGDKTVSLLIDLEMRDQLSQYLLTEVSPDLNLHLAVYTTQGALLSEVGRSGSLLALEGHQISDDEKSLVVSAGKGQPQEGLILLKTKQGKEVPALAGLYPVERQGRRLGVVAVYFLFHDNVQFFRNLRAILGVEVDLHFSLGVIGPATPHDLFFQIPQFQEDDTKMLVQNNLASGLDNYRLLRGKTGKPAGYLHLHLEGGGFLGTFITALVAYLALAVLGIFAVTILVNKASKRILDPLGTLVAGARKIAEGDLDSSIEIPGSDEITQLGREFDQMRRRLGENIRYIRELNRELNQANEMKDLFLANTSHELRTPLVGMTGILEIILDDPGNLPEEQRRQLGIVYSSSLRLTGLINDILDLSQLKKKAVNLNLTSVSLQELCRRIIDLFKPQVKNRSLTLVVQDDIPPALADPSRLEQVLVNLIGNSLKFTPEGWVVLRLGVLQEGRIKIEVADSGIGIPQDQLEKIFEAFQQASPEIAKNYGGTGLGLSISRDLVRQMGGELLVESQVGKGTVFSFSLPAAVSVSTPGGITHQQSLPGNRTLLAVDDEPVNLEVIRSQLRGTSWNLDVCSTGEDALTLAVKKSYDLIIMDIMLPGLSGFQITAALRKQSVNTPVLFLTARDNPSDRLSCLESGGTDILMKPCGRQDFLARLELLHEIFPPGDAPPGILPPGMIFFSVPDISAPAPMDGPTFRHLTRELAGLGGRHLVFIDQVYGSWIPPGVSAGAIESLPGHQGLRKLFFKTLRSASPAALELSALWGEVC